MLAGIAIVIWSFAPLWGRGPETSTIIAPPPAADSSTLGPSAQPQPTGGSDPATALDHPVNGIAFQIHVPTLGYTATVREGVDLGTLEYGPGHYPTTAWPGQAGIVGVAAHNVYWIRFSQLKPGDIVQLRTRRGLYTYRITGSEIADPNDRTILVTSQAHRLVMTTCWPLWAGAFATRRLIFFAQELGPLARPA